MDLLKKFWPQAFSCKDVAGLVITVIIYAVAGIILSALLGVAAWLLGWLPLIDIVTGALGSLLDLYCVAGIVFSFLHFFKVLK